MITKYTQLLILGLMLLPTSIQAQSANCWGNFRGNAQLTGVSSATLPDQPALLWNFNTQDGIKAAPVSCDGIVVVGTAWLTSAVCPMAIGTFRFAGSWDMVAVGRKISARPAAIVTIKTPGVFPGDHGGLTMGVG